MAGDPRKVEALTRVSHARRRGKAVHVGTVNTRPDMLEMIERGVDNIVTVEPVVLSGLMRARAERAPTS